MRRFEIEEPSATDIELLEDRSRVNADSYGRRSLLCAFAVIGLLHGDTAAAQRREVACAAAGSRAKQVELPCSEFSDKQHIVGADVDFGGGHASTGVRYLHAHRNGGGCDQVVQTFWFAYGADLRTNDLDAGAAYAIARVASFGHSPGFALETGFGGATDFERSLGAGFIGLFQSFYYLEFGATYHFPIAAERPPWLARWQFAFRIHVPVFTYARSERKYAPD